MGSNTSKEFDIVSLIISLRILLAPVFFYLVLKDYKILSLIVLLVVIFTDYIDGYLVRLFELNPNFNLYLDPSSDFIFVFFGFFAFVIKGIYPYILIFLLGFMFSQFILTSGKAPLYDPIGKYYGIFLFIVMGTTLIVDNGWSNLLFKVIALASLISLTSRIAYFKYKKIK